MPFTQYLECTTCTVVGRQRVFLLRSCYITSELKTSKTPTEGSLPCYWQERVQAVPWMFNCSLPPSELNKTKRPLSLFRMWRQNACCSFSFVYTWEVTRCTGRPRGSVAATADQLRTPNKTLRRQKQADSPHSKQAAPHDPRPSVGAAACPPARKLHSLSAHWLTGRSRLSPKPRLFSSPPVAQRTGRRAGCDPGTWSGDRPVRQKRPCHPTEICRHKGERD